MRLQSDIDALAAIEEDALMMLELDWSSRRQGETGDRHLAAADY